MAAPPPSAHVPVPFSSADLRFLGFDTKTINGWLAKGILVRSGTRGVYLSTPETGEALRNERAKQKR